MTSTPRHAFEAAARPVALLVVVAGIGAAGTLLVGAAVGMHPHELAHVALLLVPALVATMVVTAAASRLLRRTPLRGRLVVASLAGGLLGLANLAALSRTMFVSAHDATTIGVLLSYSLAAGVGAALALGRSTARAMDRISGTARSWASGDLDARIGPTRGGADVEGLAEQLDGMVAQLQRAIAAERAADRQRADLITAVSHDLRTPLARLRAMVEAVDDGVVSDEPTLRRYAAEMRRSVESLVSLVDGLFELVQLDAGAVQAESERDLVPLEDIVSDVLGVCGPAAEEAGVSVHASLDGAAGTRWSPRLERVLQNLLQNAIRHTPAGGSVAVAASRRDGWIELAVADTGEGIPADAVDRIFEPFWRGEASRTTDGSGLGLALVRRLVDALGGCVSVQSSPGTGSTFRVRLPADDGAVPD